MKKRDQDQDLYEGFSLVTGGFIYNLMGWLRKDDKDTYELKPRAFFFASLTWVPLLLLALLDGSL